MSCTAACRRSTRPVSTCRCSCGGAQHGTQAQGGASAPAPGVTEAIEQPCPASAVEYARGFEQSRAGRFGAWLASYTREDFEHMRCFQAAGGKVGGAIKTAQDGVPEIVALYNNGGPKGSGRRMLAHLVANGARRLDCIGEGLRGVYESAGFRVTDTITWDDTQAPGGWDYERNGRPNLYVMEIER